MASLIPERKSQPATGWPFHSYLPSTAAENLFALLVVVTLPAVEKEISETHHLVASSHRSDPHRPTRLLRLAELRTMRNKLSPNMADLDKSITHLTEATLLPFQFPFQSSHYVVHVFFELAKVLLSRFHSYRRFEDVKYSIEYFRFLRVNFHPLQVEASNIPRGHLTSLLVLALAGNSRLRSWDMIQDLEMVALFRELLSSDASESSYFNDAIVGFSRAIGHAFSLEDVKLPPEQVIQVLREAETIIPYSEVSYALAICLTQRFLTAHVINDYEDAIAIADRIVAAHHPGDGLTPVQRGATNLIQALVVSRSNSYSSPEYLEDAIHRFRSLLSLPSLPDQKRTSLARILDAYVQRRSSYYDVSGNSTFSHMYFFYQSRATDQPDSVREDGPIPQMLEKVDRLKEILAKIKSGEIMDVEAAVQRGRTLLPSHSSDRLTVLPASTLAQIFFHAHRRTKRLDYLNEAIIAYRDLRKLSAPKRLHFEAGFGLIESMFTHCDFLHAQDFEEAWQLFPEVANDGSGEVFIRFRVSCHWALIARQRVHPSVSTAYETAMALMQETLVFSPTLQIQHFRLSRSLGEVGALPSDYASYQIETGQIKQAIVTLERGRALLWSEMRGLRTSTDQLHAADPVLTEGFADINRRLEAVTMSVAQSESVEGGDSGTGTGRPEGMDSIGRLVSEKWRLLEERETLISQIQSFPGFEGFLKPPSFDVLNSAAAHGPVIIINQYQFRSYIIILLKHSPPSVIFTPSNFHDRANQLKDELLRVRKEKGLDSEDYDLTLAHVLADLYELVGKLVIERLRQLRVPEKSRIWWCPTDAFCSLPLHAMGPIPSDDRDDVYFMDLYIPSYTPTLSALVESRKPGSPTKMVDKPSLLLVAQPETLPGAWGEINVLEGVGSPVTTLVSEKATPTTVAASLKNHQFVHFVCHGLLEPGKPFDASFDLHGGRLTLLKIVQSQLPAAEFAFLSACHTAELTEDSVADEGLHLAAAMQFCGFRSVIGTMWAMADTDGADLSRHFYKYIFSDSAGRRGVPYHERSARSLQIAVKKLRRKRGMTLERWVNFVHYGA
jgi:hypothetical protein